MKTMKIIKYTKWYLLLSLMVLIPGVVSLFSFGLNLSIDFKGGSVFEYKFPKIEDKNFTTAKIKTVFDGNKVVVENINIDAGSVVTVRTKTTDSQANDILKTKLTAEFPGIEQLSFETVGPSIGAETTKNSLIALVAASLGILLYIAYAFRNIPKPYSSFRFGVCAIIAMLHDAFVVLGIFSLLGHFFKIEIDALFITAVLTVIGFSVHDTIVVFDRIRENLKKLPGNLSFSEIVNYSLVETLNRSLATSLTVIFTLSALLLLGGATIRNFVLALLIGIISGTYSSIFNAAPILVIWEKWVVGRKKKAS